MEKSSGFKDEIYKIVKYQTKLASSQNLESSRIYRQKLSEHVEKMRMVGGQDILNAISGGVFDKEALLEARKKLIAEQNNIASDSERNAREASEALSMAEEARDAMLENQGIRISDLLRDAQRLQADIDKATADLTVSQKGIEDCNADVSKYKEFIDEQDAEIRNLITKNKGSDSGILEQQTEELVKKLKKEILRKIDDIEKYINTKLKLDKLKSRIETIEKTEFLRICKQIDTALYAINKDSAQSAIDAIVAIK